MDGHGRCVIANARALSPSVFVLFRMMMMIVGIHSLTPLTFALRAIERDGASKRKVHRGGGRGRASLVLPSCVE